MRMIFGAIGGMKIGRGNRSTRRKRAPAPLCPPQIRHDQTRARSLGRRGGKPATNRLSYGAASLFKYNFSEIGICLRLQVEPTQLGSIDRASPCLWVWRRMSKNVSSSQTFRSHCKECLDNFLYFIMHRVERHKSSMLLSWQMCEGKSKGTVLTIGFQSDWFVAAAKTIFLTVSIEWSAPNPRIPDSNLNSETGYRDRIFFIFLSPSREM
jgi:hypothetical protein